MTDDQLYDKFRSLVDPMIRKLLLDLPDDQIDETAVRAKYQELSPQLATVFTLNYGTLLSSSQIQDFTNRMIKQYLLEMPVNKPAGFSYKSTDCVPWVKSITDSDWYFWDRYERYLLDEKGWERKVIKTMSEDTLKLLDMMVDPRPESYPNGADRRGLVVADVQSGKTSNYIGLMCRAADAGYKVIIVLAGIYNVLRGQTQVRIEEGFTGFDSTDNKQVGVGKISAKKRWNYGSTRIQDFGKSTMKALMGSAAGNSNSWVFVVKKNKSVLQSLNQWLDSHPNIEGPLLLIDDEADNASINVKYAKDDISAINGLIRKLLRHFKKSSYVGYTATPFANILIDPAAQSDEEGSDIFPRSFIYTLEPSTTYFGSEKVFAGIDEDGTRPDHIRFIDDIDKLLPAKHKKDYSVPYLPDSLRAAARTFVIASAIRVARGQESAHTTMMVNVSPYTAVQKQVTELIKDYVTDLRVSARAYALLPNALDSQEISDLYGTFQEEYSTEGISWDEVRKRLYDVMLRIRVVLINSASKDALNYEAPNVEHAIAVGGYRLSRGLTLEGLLVSYYSRNARAYDTLMQMARWYGYRPGYESLCRVWMTQDAASWYAFVADATEELVGHLRDMLVMNSDPSMYGLMVRQCPSSLIITARNKMGVGKKVSKPFDLNGTFIETTALLRKQSTVETNFAAARTLIKTLASSYC